jgi:hypothetical protein
MLEFVKPKNGPVAVHDYGTKAWVGNLSCDPVKGWVFRPTNSRDGRHSADEVRLSHMEEIVAYAKRELRG